ncbi:hypothetical protein JD844_032236 [Phrynosoma platyrhinos]|uniref:Sodium/hydrogen exchanger regulatory region domain-containing protein n=1 Tax=Phrynosoma platyrhinos TaxID=52577 RepID=A0ABQ7T4M1_PHRPL|nr:hypothetical protein JD844_032236 [Phrynosoma platyrhinos]
MLLSFQTLSYNRYNLAADASEEQAKEILIRRQQSLRQPMRKGSSLPWGGQAAARSVRYLSLPFGNTRLNRREARNNEDLTGDSGSDSESVFIKLNSEPQPESHRRKQQQQQMLPMKQLPSRLEPAGFTGWRRRTNEGEKITREQTTQLLLKPHHNVLAETDIQELESEDEVNTASFSLVPSIKWTAETRDEKHFYRPKRHFTGRKE